MQVPNGTGSGVWRSKRPVIVLGVLSENLSHHYEKTLTSAFKVYCAEVLFNWMDARGFKSSIITKCDRRTEH